LKDKKLINQLTEILIDIAGRKNLLEETQEELKIALRALKNERVRKILYYPKLSLKEREEFLHQVLSSYGLSGITTTFLVLLLERESLGYLKEILLRYEELSNKLLNLKKVVITTAVPLAEEERVQLKEAFGRLTASRVKLEEQIDKRILGGVVAQIGDRLIDGSIRSSLNRLKEEMNR